MWWFYSKCAEVVRFTYEYYFPWFSVALLKKWITVSTAFMPKKKRKQKAG